MESDSIRASGSDTLIDIWVDGKLRAICIKSAAIAAFPGVGDCSDMSDERKCEFVRTHLPDVVAAVKAKLRSDPAAERVLIEAGQFGGTGERRKSERRKNERRKTKRPAQDLPHPERRRGQRRGADRRRPTEGGT